MNASMKNQIISELDELPDNKGYSLLDYLHFLKQDEGFSPNKETINAIEEVEKNRDKLKSYSSADELFDDLGIEA